MDIAKTNSHRAPIVLIHGREGLGKTTTAARFPKPLFLDLEHGFPAGVTADAVQGVRDFTALMTALRELYQEKGAGHSTLVVDTLDQLEAMILLYVCTENGWKTIETPSFGKGWVAADLVWRKFLRAITALRDDLGMTIVLIAHSAIERVEDPRAPAYTSHVLRLHRRARALVMDAADIIGFLADDLRVITEDGGFRERVRATASQMRFLFVEGTPAFAAKNRYGMPNRIEVPKDFKIESLLQYITPPPSEKEATNGQ